MQIITTQKEGNNLFTHSDLTMNNQCIKRLHLIFVILSILIAINLHAQDYLPQNYSLIFGGGLALSAVEGNKNDFFSLTIEDCTDIGEVINKISKTFKDMYIEYLENTKNKIN